MKKILDFVFKNRLLITVTILFVAFVLLYLFFPRQREVILPATGPSYNSLTPGLSERADFVTKLGEPVAQDKVGIYDVLSFDSPTTERPDEVFFEEGKAVLIKEIITYNTDRNIDTLKETYGNASLILYGEDSIAGFYLFVYPDQGIAYIGNPNSGVLLEVWYFTPVSASEFKQNWAQGYSEILKENPHEGDSVDFR